MTASKQAALSAQIQNWIAQNTNSAAVAETVKLQGGMSSAVFRVSVYNGEEKQAYVLRIFDNDEWNRQEPDLARHEATSLRLAGQAAVETPQILAYDEAGRHSGGKPSVLMSLLEGSVIIEPDDMVLWLDGLAAALAPIHRLDASSFPWAYRTYMNLDEVGRQAWSSVPELWEEAVRLAKQPRPDYKPCFIHRDYHPTNVLWQQGRVSGVVDWVNACSGPAGIDVGHCRLNLAQLHGVHSADVFLEAYIRHAGGAFTYDPYWDLLSLMDILFDTPTVYVGWTALGAADLTDRLIQNRLDEYLISVMERCR